ncbi:polysaccharide deacetylase family protein [Nocardioides sp. zg-ZUI104]|uniref:polysaccharide deacetylase family protein n=1 Tax=Nocardioides faecalis TaxID=2803858 RepID=UPI001BCD18D3|nr:polysaccharide deacetylase family protein [Nocardioides faecalis]MBS4752992.1 polysaccharide deacetylase family protein [Nocardioides faecalis]
MPPSASEAAARLTRRTSRWVARRTHTRPVPVPSTRAIVSLTFDDVIASACTEGARILAEHGVAGTYYVAGGLTGQVEEGKPTHERADLERLHADGHQLACHGWSHRPAPDLSPAELAAELRINAEMLASITGSSAALDYAFPLGAYGRTAKRICAEVRRSCRTTGGGLHRGTVDLALLGSHRLYGPDARRPAWEALLEELVTGPGGWAILNTHAVEEDPGPYGTRSDVLREVLRAAQDRGIEILPVGAVAAQLSGGLQAA